MPITFNALETDRFGIRCARVDDANAPLAAINAATEAEAIDFLSVRVSTDDIARVQALEDDGYRLMDTIVYYRTLLSMPFAATTNPKGVEIRIATRDDAEAVSVVASDAFEGFFGHFHADERLSSQDCDAVYADWAKSCVTTQTATLPALVAHTSGQIVGFLANRQIDEACVDITLNAVTREMQGRGVYGALLDRAMQQMAVSRFKEVTISTQVNNIPVQRAWAKRGFRMQRSYYTLHKWIDRK